MEFIPCTRLILPRSDGEVRLQLAIVDRATIVQLVRIRHDGTRTVIAFRPDELDRLDEVIRECRRLTVGVPDKKAEFRAAQELVGLTVPKSGKPLARTRAPKRARKGGA